MSPPERYDGSRGVQRDPTLVALTAQLTRDLRTLVDRVRGFSTARWASTAPPFPRRADVAFHLAEVLAEASLAAAGLPHQPLPRLDDAVLPDQLTVTGADLLAALAEPPAVITWRGMALAPVDVAVAVLAEALLHRMDLDGSAPPPAALAALRDAPGWMMPGPRSGRRALAEFQRFAADRCRRSQARPPGSYPVR